jgi:hypothetical protein
MFAVCFEVPQKGNDPNALVGVLSQDFL